MAIVGMAGHFPGASTVEDFWHNISPAPNRSPDSPIANCERRASARRTCRSSVREGRRRPGRHRDVRRRLLRPHPTRRAIIDPQQRRSWRPRGPRWRPPAAIPARRTGNWRLRRLPLSTYLLRNLQHNPDVVSASGDLQLILRNDKDSLGPDRLRARLAGPELHHAELLLDVAGRGAAACRA